MRHVRVMARLPRPVGSPEHARVRDYIVDELSALGLFPDIQRTTGVRTARNALLSAPVHNIVARVRGAGSGSAVMLAAHYDSVGSSPGASDNAHAVAVILETLRALQEEPPLKNDLIILFTDCEEIGLLGAQAFVDEHPWAGEVGLVLNFEARGTHGPAVLFETSTPNGQLVREFLDAVPDPVTNSFVNSLYRRLPFDTDLTVFLEAGYAGLNLAYVAGLAPYHTALDDLQRIDPRSVQQQGSYALALTKRFGNFGLSEIHEPDAVFFNLLGPMVVSYPATWGTWLTVLVALAFVGIVSLGVRRKALSVTGMILGFLALALCVIGAAGIVTLLWWIIVRLHRGYQFFVQGDTYNSGLYISAFAALSFSITIRLYSWFRRKVSVQDLSAGALLGWLICLVAASLLLPAGNYLFAWPLLFGLAVLGFIVSSRERETFSKLDLAVLGMGAIPGVLLLVQMVYLLFILTALYVPGVVMIPAVLLIGLLIPQIHLLSPTIRRRMSAAGMLVFVCLIIAGSATSGVDSDRPRQNSICYSLNADTGKAAWISLDPTPDEWTSQFLTASAALGSLTEQIPWAKHEVLHSPAPGAPLNAPEAEIIDDSIGADGVRILRLRIRSARSASVIVVWVGSAITIAEANVDGTRIDYSDRAAAGQGIPRLVVCSEPPEEGLQLVLVMTLADPARLNVTDATPGLPAIPGFSVKPRPPDMISKPVPWLTDSTVVSRTFVIPGSRAKK